MGFLAGVPLGHLADRRGPRDGGAARGEQGLALHIDTPAAYLSVLAMDAVSFLAAALVLRGLPALPGSPPVAAGEPALAVLRDRPYAVISALNMVMLLNMPLLSLVIPLWIVQRTEAPRWLVSALFVLNTVSVVLFQVRVARRVRGLRSAARMARLSGVVMLVACAVFAVSAAGSSAWLAAGALLIGAGLQVAGEMMLASGAWEISFDLAPADK